MSTILAVGTKYFAIIDDKSLIDCIMKHSYDSWQDTTIIMPFLSDNWDMTIQHYTGMGKQYAIVDEVVEFEELFGEAV